MGVEYKAKLVVGLPYDELHELLSDCDPDDLGLEEVSPYYDASRDDCVYGVLIGRTSVYCWREIDLTGVQEAGDQFFKITGKVGKVILSPHGY